MSLKVALLLLLCNLFVISKVEAQQVNDAQLQRYLQEGEKALVAGQYDAAAQAYDKLRKLAPKMAEAHARLGLIYYQQGKFEQAESSLQYAIKLKPTLPNIDLLLGMTLSELGRYSEGLPVLEKGFRLTTDSTLKRASGLQLTRCYTGLGQNDKAVEVALELSRLYAKDPEVLYHVGRLFGNYAYLSTVKLAEVAPDSLWLHLAAGEANESRERPDAAIQEYREVLSRRPNYPGIHYRIGRALLVRARQAIDNTVSEAEALKEFEQELLVDSTNANAAYEAGEIYRKSVQSDKALELFSHAAKYDSEFVEALIALGRTLVVTGKIEQALAPLNRAIKIEPTNETAWYQLAHAQRALGNAVKQQKALAEFQRLRELNRHRKENNILMHQAVTKQSLDAKPSQ